VAVVEAFAKSTMWVGMKFERRDSITKRKVRVYHSFSDGGLLIVDLGKVRRCEPCGICSGGGIVETSPTIKIEKAPVRCEVGSDRSDTPPVSFCKRHSLNFL
jgi:hypothetical protein